ncbi:MAG: hypothetical protein JWP88_1768 [Flaviaesturariibacter sp.]|nr:hypothetical protein [Flaviaesturariibacter sp.]
MDKEKVTLQFQTPQDLTNFRKSLDARQVRTDIPNLRLTCECTKNDLALAMNSFGAKVIE